MPSKSHLQTVRFSPDEARVINDYLNKNRLFESFSALARVATLAFIGEERTFRLSPVVGAKKQAQRPAFFWDYDLTESQIREILHRPGMSVDKLWIIERILAQATSREAFNFLDVETIRRALPRIRLPEKRRRWWKYAVARWSQTDAR